MLDGQLGGWGYWSGWRPDRIISATSAVCSAVSKGRVAFNDLVGLATPLGLYAEEIDPATGRHLGNYPQALTHAAPVQAALALRDAASPPAERIA